MSPYGSFRAALPPAISQFQALSIFWFVSGLGTIFSIVAFQMFVAPQHCLSPLGVDYLSQSISGRAELRAYYIGSSLSLAASFFKATLHSPSVSSVRWALRTGALVLGSFALSRAASYAQEGRDRDDRLHAADATFVAEVVGATIALALLGAMPEEQADEKKTQ